MFKRYFLAVVILAFFAGQACADGLFTAGAEVGGWFTELDAKVKSSTTALVGTEIDVVSDLGVDDSESIPAGEIWLKLGEKNKFSLSYFGIDYSGQKTITKSINFNNQTYSISDAVSSKLEISVTELGYERTVLSNEMAKLGLTIGIKHMDFEGSLSTTAISKSESIDGLVPMVGFVVEVTPIEQLSICAECNGISIDAGDVDGSLVDLTLGVKYNFNEYWHIFGGYRYFNINVDSDDDSADLTLKGPVISVIGNF